MDKRLARWERLRAKGWWLVTATFFSGVTVGFRALTERPQHLEMIPFAFIVFPLGGLAWGFLVWKLNERAYQKFLSSHPEPAGHSPSL